MATNFQEIFDDAIKRAGRFDFLLCMGPPTLKAKLPAIHVFLGIEKSTHSDPQSRCSDRVLCQS